LFRSGGKCFTLGRPMKTESSGMISRLKAHPVMAILIFLLFCLMAVIGYIVVKLLTFSEQDQRHKDLVAELRASSYQVVSLSRDATAGNEQAFARLTSVVGRMDQTWNQLSSLDGQTRAYLSSELAAYEGVW